MNRRFLTVLGCALFGVATFSLFADTLLLEIGSDWDPSSASVRKLYESDAFRSALPEKTRFGVWDDCESPTDAVKAENEKWTAFHQRTVRGPALFAFDAQGRCYLRFENLLSSMKPADLASKVKDAQAVYKKAVDLFAKAAEAEGVEAAELYGLGFEALDPYLPGATENWVLNERETSRGKNAFAREWAALKAADPNDRSGWQARFTRHDGFDDIFKADDLTRNRKLNEVQAFIAELRDANQTHWTVEQKQSVDLAEFAFLRYTNKKADGIELLKKIVAAGPDTIWGACARGYLKIETARGELKPEPPARQVMKLTPRATVEGSFAIDEAKLLAAVEKVAEDPKALAEKGVATKILKLAVLDLVESDAIEAVAKREGGEKFLKTFFGDRAWLEDFLCSGPINNPKDAFRKLDRLVFEAGDEALKDGALRRVATALALNGDKTETGALVATFKAYYDFLAEGRIHARALKQTVFDWRRAVGSIFDARDLRMANRLAYLSRRDWGSAHEPIPYRMHNCFGEFVHQPERYYGPWYLSGWTERYTTLRVGGVCGAQGHMGELINSSHGIPVVACHEPEHCCYTVMGPDGTWKLCNPIRPYTDPYVTFAKFSGLTPLDVATRVYVTNRESTLRSDTLRFAARALQNRKAPVAKVSALYRAATEAQSENFVAWQWMLGYLAQAEAPVRDLERWATGAAKALADTRNVFWGVLTPYCMLRAEKSKADAASEMVRLHALYRTNRVKVNEEMNYEELMDQQAEILKDAPEEMIKVIRAALLAHGGEKSYLTGILTSAEKFLQPNRKLRAAYREAVAEMWKKIEAQPDKGAGLDFSPMILGASRAADFAGFRLAVDLNDRANPVKSGKGFPKELKGSVLLSDKGMLQVTSQHAVNDKPSRYQRALDTTPWLPSKPAFCTMFADAPYAIVTLAESADLTYIQIDAQLGARDLPTAFPLDVFVSDNGRDWTKVASFSKPQKTVSVPMFDKPIRGRYVKLVRGNSGQKRLFQLHKILVYGKPLSGTVTTSETKPEEPAMKPANESKPEPASPVVDDGY